MSIDVMSRQCISLSGSSHRPTAHGQERRTASTAVLESSNAQRLLCLIDLTKAGDKASLLVDQVVENDDEFRRGLTPFEPSRALFLAHQAGATRTEIRKRTGRSRQEVADALAAGRLSEDTRRSARAMEYEWTLDELALLDEFDGDTEALARVDLLISRCHSGRHAIELVRQERQEAAAHRQALADLEDAAQPSGRPCGGGRREADRGPRTARPTPAPPSDSSETDTARTITAAGASAGHDQQLLPRNVGAGA